MSSACLNCQHAEHEDAKRVDDLGVCVFLVWCDHPGRNPKVSRYIGTRSDLILEGDDPYCPEVREP